MPRLTRDQIDDEIVEHAAALFARHGVRDTSVQRIADATGYSKTGLLHRFPSKDALWAAVVDRSVALTRSIADEVADLPPGPDRDRAAITALADLTLRRPGTVALLLSVFSTLGRVEDTPLLAGIAEPLMAAFGLVPFGVADAPTPDELARTTRVVGALGAVAVAGIALREAPAADVRRYLIEVGSAALGRPGPGRT